MKQEGLFPITGETWLSRDGTKFTIIDIKNNIDDFPVIALDHKKRFHKFTRTGRFVSNTFFHQNDLIKKL